MICFLNVTWVIVGYFSFGRCVIAVAFVFGVFSLLAIFCSF